MATNSSEIINTNFDIPDTTVLGIIYLCVSMSIMVSNGIVVVVVCTTSALHLRTIWMLAFRATIDFLMGLNYLVFVVPSAFLNHFAYPDSFIAVSSCITTFLFGQIILNIAMTVLDRCIAVKRPLTYGSVLTTRKVVIVICGSFVINVLRLLLIIMPDGDFYYNEVVAACGLQYDKPVEVVASIGVAFITLVLIVVCSCVIGVEIRRHHQRSRDLGASVTPQSTKFQIMVTLSAGVFSLSYIPFVIIVFLSIALKRQVFPELLIRIVVVAILSNSLWNVFIYSATYRPFRKACLRLLCKRVYRERRRAEGQTFESDVNSV